MKKIALTALMTGLLLTACSSKANNTETADTAEAAEVPVENSVVFDADSAYSYVARQVEFGPRVPNTDAHRQAGDWLSAQLRSRGAEVTEQNVDLKAFDGTLLKARNILGRYNPGEEHRTLLVAHWDCRPWADEDPDPEKRKLPVDGANDGASGVGVLLEIARQISMKNPGRGVDILFVDAEDWGDSGNDDSWALGAKHFVNNPPVFDGKAYMPSEVILLDMVGGEGAVFPREYFSQQNAPALADALWAMAAASGYGDRFPNRYGGAITDDHIKFIEKGIPAIDIIEYRADTGFCPVWHTSSDNMDHIDRGTLKAVGQTVTNYIFR